MSAAKSIMMNLPADKQIILADESNTSGLGSMPHWSEAPAHDSINQTVSVSGVFFGKERLEFAPEFCILCKNTIKLLK